MSSSILQSYGEESSADDAHSSEIWYKNQLYSKPTDSNSETVIEQTVITTASLVLSDYQNDTEKHLSDYENNTTSPPPQGILSKSSSTSSTASLNLCSINKSSHSLSSTSLSSVTFPLYNPIEYETNPHYSFYTSDCEDHSDYIPSSFPRSIRGLQGTPSPLISRPSSPLPPTPSPNFSRSPSPSRSSRLLRNNYLSNTPNNSWLQNSPKYTRSLNNSRETSPLRLRPSSYTRPLSPNPPTISPGFSATNRVVHCSGNCQSGSNSPAFSSMPPIGNHISLRSPPSPARLLPTSHRSSYAGRSPVTSRPPSPLNTRQHNLLLSNPRPARSQSQPPASHRLHSRTRSTRTPSPRPPRLPSSANSPHYNPPPPPAPPTSPLPNPGKRHSRMRAR